VERLPKWKVSPDLEYFEAVRYDMILVSTQTLCLSCLPHIFISLRPHLLATDSLTKERGPHFK
jgi:hypothetical protein